MSRPQHGTNKASNRISGAELPFLFSIASLSFPSVPSQSVENIQLQHHMCAKVHSRRRNDHTVLSSSNVSRFVLDPHFLVQFVFHQRLASSPFSTLPTFPLFFVQHEETQGSIFGAALSKQETITTPKACLPLVVVPYLVNVGLREHLRNTNGIQFVELDKIVADVKMFFTTLQQKAQDL